MQYTAACALVFYLNTNGIFSYNPMELLVYDYLGYRKYIWEAKKFMNDINILRDYNFLIRAQSSSKTSRDVNAHQCSTIGQDYINKNLIESTDYQNILNVLSSDKDILYDIQLGKDSPVLVCKDNPKKNRIIDGFLHELQTSQSVAYTAFYL